MPAIDVGGKTYRTLADPIYLKDGRQVKEVWIRPTDSGTPVKVYPDRIPGEIPDMINNVDNRSFSCFAGEAVDYDYVQSSYELWITPLYFDGYYDPERWWEYNPHVWNNPNWRDDGWPRSDVVALKEISGLPEVGPPAGECVYYVGTGDRFLLGTSSTGKSVYITVPSGVYYLPYKVRGSGDSTYCITVISTTEDVGLSGVIEGQDGTSTAIEVNTTQHTLGGKTFYLSYIPLPVGFVPDPNVDFSHSSYIGPYHYSDSLFRSVARIVGGGKESRHQVTWNRFGRSYPLEVGSWSYNLNALTNSGGGS